MRRAEGGGGGGVRWVDTVERGQVGGEGRTLAKFDFAVVGWWAVGVLRAGVGGVGWGWRAVGGGAGLRAFWWREVLAEAVE